MEWKYGSIIFVLSFFSTTHSDIFFGLSFILDILKTHTQKKIEAIFTF